MNLMQMVEIPAIKEVRKVKSMQMFRRPVEQATQGDRVGICVTQFEPKLLERGLVAAPSFIPSILAAVVSLRPIRFFAGKVTTKAKFHVSIGHETLLARISLFRSRDSFSTSKEFEFTEEMEKEEEDAFQYFGLLEFEKSLSAVPNSLVIGSKLDMDVHTSTCRLAFWGRLLLTFSDKNYVTKDLPQLKIFKEKCKQGLVERAQGVDSVIVKSLFKKETNLQLFSNMKVTLSTGEEGTIEGGFGQSGKVKVYIPGALSLKLNLKFNNRSGFYSEKSDIFTLQVNLLNF